MAVYPLFSDTAAQTFPINASHVPEHLHISQIVGDILSTESVTLELKKPLITQRRKLPKDDNAEGDSQSRRDLLLKGRKGTRRRQRYENANFLNVPNSQLPLPSDWEIHPTYPVYRNIPYYLAPLWEGKFQRQFDERLSSRSHSTRGRVPRDIKAALKKAKGARFLLQVLEDEIRTFIQDYIDESAINDTYKSVDSDEEDIVFIGLDKESQEIVMSDEAKIVGKKLVFEEKREYNGFHRWLVHELAEYYGLESKSEEVENGSSSQSKKRIIVGFGKRSGRERGSNGAVRNGAKTSHKGELDFSYEMPRPLWGLV